MVRLAGKQREARKTGGLGQARRALCPIVALGVTHPRFACLTMAIHASCFSLFTEAEQAHQPMACRHATRHCLDAACLPGYAGKMCKSCPHNSWSPGGNAAVARPVKCLSCPDNTGMPEIFEASTNTDNCTGKASAWMGLRSLPCSRANRMPNGH